MRIKVKVITNADKDEIVEKDDILVVKTKNPPIKDKANRAVIKLLTKHFNARVKIVSGHKNREKWIEVEERFSI
ncbi:MAG: DUF167 domain-containing protein [Candidatus Methanoliparum thermophilum]|uniref:DUF167 domain-containing protein n=1 Tax=Methanoliparum thermophilum TaxID=2491083 RepID=A0A520KR76_METT2|nr:DUF167 domain-containing protein [Candidatus Methanoliparum sp. LAM-1]RZN64081.1 MAG: DUF167 domain-containing protein [Candidatus Methanoliparum thermophilum]BDC35659.1 hypothetical protein MTLP_03410 [Candidatus Methanoliparum sp. LAM-1]